jgi:hypothetical protein
VALKCAPRDAWIGWTPALQFRRLPLIANNVRFLILPQWHGRNFASRILALNLRRLSADWERYYGHPLPLVETSVDPVRFRGTFYQAAGWQALGLTHGFAKRHRGYVPHGHPKQVWVRPLHPRPLLVNGSNNLGPGNRRGHHVLLPVGVNALVSPAH